MLIAQGAVAHVWEESSHVSLCVIIDLPEYEYVGLKEYIRAHRTTLGVQEDMCPWEQSGYALCGWG